MQKALFAIAITLAGIQPASAQLTPISGLRAGDTVRVWAVGPRLSGESGVFDAFLRDTLRFTSIPRPPFTTIAVPYPALRRIDVLRGRRRSPMRIVIGTVLGAAVGAAAGSLLGMAVECGRNCGDEGELEGLAGFIFGGGAGIVVGGAAGGIIAARQRTPYWDAVDLRR